MIKIFAAIIFAYTVTALVIGVAYSKDLNKPDMIKLPVIFFGATLLISQLSKLLNNDTLEPIVNCVGFILADTLVIWYAWKKANNKK